MWILCEKLNSDERDRKLHEQESFQQQERSDWEDIEEALRGQIKQLKKKNSEMVRPNGETERHTWR